MINVTVFHSNADSGLSAMKVEGTWVEKDGDHHEGEGGRRKKTNVVFSVVWNLHLKIYLPTPAGRCVGGAGRPWEWGGCRAG